MKLSDFNFELPKNLLAQHPSVGRDESKLMVLNRVKKTISHHTFKDIIDFFEEGDVLVLNNTKVFPARLLEIKKRLELKLRFFYFVN